MLGGGGTIYTARIVSYALSQVQHMQRVLSLSLLGLVLLALISFQAALNQGLGSRLTDPRLNASVCMRKRGIRRDCVYVCVCVYRLLHLLKDQSSTSIGF